MRKLGRDAKRADTTRFAAFHRGLLERGVYLALSQFEAGFVSTAHGEEEIEATVAAAREMSASLGRSLQLSRGEVLLVTLTSRLRRRRRAAIAEVKPSSPALGIETHVLAPQDLKWLHSDSSCTFPPRPGRTASATRAARRSSWRSQ